MSYTSIISEGGLLPLDVLAQVTTTELSHDQPISLNTITAAWTDARAYWNAFNRLYKNRQDRLNSRKLKQLTFDNWIDPLFERLDYDLATVGSVQVGSRNYEISHRADSNQDSPPVHILARDTSLYQPPVKRGGRSPYSLVQEYLNNTEHVWGVISNGDSLRLLRDSAQIMRPRYLEFNLRAMMDGEQFNEFTFFFRVLHRSRLPQDIDHSSQCPLERYHQQAIESGGRIREKLRFGVKLALESLGNGLLTHRDNATLRQSIADGHLSERQFYSELLRVIYRILFLIVIEDRNLIALDADQDELQAAYRGSHDQRLRWYMQHYSLRRLRYLAEHISYSPSSHQDLWFGLQTSFELFDGYSNRRGAELLGIHPLNGDLFGESAIRNLMNTSLSNSALLAAIRALSLYDDQRQQARQRRVNYALLDVEELGSIYESLLDFRPTIGQGNQWYGAWHFSLIQGNERKTTGSYYTPPALVHELVKSAVEPILQERLCQAHTQREQEQAILGMSVCDPACGSGHPLLAAARRMGRELAIVRAGDSQPSPSIYRQAIRDVISHCIYGVDNNELAVDLCKVALWIEGHCAGQPLSFLDHHIRHGNSLLGTTSAKITQGIPDDAYKPIIGDDKKVASTLKQRNKTEREAWIKHGMFQMQFDTSAQAQQRQLNEYTQFEHMDDSTIEFVNQKKKRFEQLHANLADQRTSFNLWTAAFFSPINQANHHLIPTTRDLLDWQANRGVRGDLIGYVNSLAQQHDFFHFELEFPLVFRHGGFDVIIGNPPWERIKLQEQEFFAEHNRAIAEAPNKAARQRLIDQLPLEQPQLAATFEQAKHSAEAQSRFVRASGLFPLTAVGDVNTYALFSELDRLKINQRGRTCIIVPTGIATDDSTKAFFGDLVQQRQLISLFDFENRESLFSGVHRSYKFSLLSMGRATKPIEFVFFATKPEQIDETQRRFQLTPQEIALLNPNTLTCPVFRTKADAELTKKIYQRVPILEHEGTGANPWGISFLRMFDMSNDSDLFETAANKHNLPLYEAKMLHQFTHRWATYSTDGSTIELTSQDLTNPNSTIMPRYWVDKQAITERLKGRWNHRWLLGFRDVTNATNERTFIFSVIPCLAVGHKAPLFFSTNSISKQCAFLGTINSFVVDFITRQKIGGTSLSFFIIKQLPVLPPETFGATELAFIVPRVLELVYTAWDMQPFAEDVWQELDAAGRELVLERQRDCNWAADSALFSPRDGFGLAPFCWNDERRAQIRAELDVLIAKLYGLTRNELRYILDPADVYGTEFPGETFRVLKEREIREYGEYRTQRLVLAAWDELEHRA